MQSVKCQIADTITNQFKHATRIHFVFIQFSCTHLQTLFSSFPTATSYSSHLPMWKQPQFVEFKFHFGCIPISSTHIKTAACPNCFRLPACQCYVCVLFVNCNYDCDTNQKSGICEKIFAEKQGMTKTQTHNFRFPTFS